MRKIAKLMLTCLFISPAAVAANFTLTSPQLKENGRIARQQVFNGMGCKGSNISPALRWTGAPPDTKSFAVTLYDPDAPTGAGWWHWVIFDIPPNVSSLQENAGNLLANVAPAGSVQSRTDFGKPGYGGPCPPPGTKPHHYRFTVYALKTDKLPVKDVNTPPDQVGFYIQKNKIGSAVLIGLYSR